MLVVKSIRMDKKDIDDAENLAILMSNELQISINFSDVLRLGIKELVKKYNGGE